MHSCKLGALHGSWGMSSPAKSSIPKGKPSSLSSSASHPYPPDCQEVPILSIIC